MVHFWTLTYALAFLGSVSFGYLIMRFGMPDTRILPKQIKLGVASIAGFVLFAISAFIAYFVFTPIYLYFILPLITALALAFIHVRDTFFSPKTVRVAIPVARIAPVAVPAKAPEMALKAKAEKRKAREIPAIKEEGKKPLTTFVSRIEETQASEKIGAIQKSMERAVEAPERLRAHEEEYVRPAGSPYVARREERQKKREAAEKPAPAPEKPAQPSIPAPSPAVTVQPSAAAPAAESRRERYLRRRGELVEQAKADMTKPAESAPLPIVPEEEVNLEVGEGLDLSDLQSVSDLSELSSEEGLVGLESVDVSLGDLAGLSEIENVPKERGMSCPHCGSKKTTIVYCPYCGKGLCSNCADKVHSEGNLTFYECPTCKKEVIVKKE
ncbi:MAG: hypothetical protein QXO69_03040 [archaeon]